VSPRPLVVGIAGGSGAGKTTLVGRLVEALGAPAVTVLDHARYYRNRTGDRAAFNFDHPDSFETPLLVHHVRALRDGQVAQVPLYNCTRGARQAETTPMPPAPTIIVEGILVFADDTLRALMDVKVFVDADADLRFIRRLQRDMADRGCSMAAVIDQYVTTVKPMHETFVEPSRRFADIIVPEGGQHPQSVDLLVAIIRHRANGWPA
jgi:uridine kinase